MDIELVKKAFTSFLKTNGIHNDFLKGVVENKQLNDPTVSGYVEYTKHRYCDKRENTQIEAYSEMINRAFNWGSVAIRDTPHSKWGEMWSSYHAAWCKMVRQADSHGWVSFPDSIW